MSNWREGFYDAVRTAAGLPEDAKVISIEDQKFYGGYCDTCSYEEVRAVITYELDGETQTYNFYDSFSGLMQSLSD